MKSRNIKTQTVAVRNAFHTGGMINNITSNPMNNLSELMDTFFHPYWPMQKMSHLRVQLSSPIIWNLLILIRFQTVEKRSSCWWFETAWLLLRRGNGTLFAMLWVSFKLCKAHFYGCIYEVAYLLSHWRCYKLNGVSNHRRLVRLFDEQFVQVQINKNHQSFASLVCVRGIYGWPVDSPHKGPVTRKMFPFDDVIIYEAYSTNTVNENWT